MTLTDRQRVELALPARLMLMAVQVALGDDEDAASKEILADLRSACVQPIADLTAKDQGRLARRIERTSQGLVAEFNRKTSAGKVAMSVFYFIEAAIEHGFIELFEGSPMANATNKVLVMLNPDFEKAELDRSAQKQGKKILGACQALGLYA